MCRAACVQSRWIKSKTKLQNYNRDIAFRMLPQTGAQAEVLGGHTRKNSATRNILTQSSSTALVATGRSNPGLQINRNSDQRLSAVSFAPLGNSVGRVFQAFAGIIAPNWGAPPNVPSPRNVSSAGSRSASPETALALQDLNATIRYLVG